METSEERPGQPSQPGPVALVGSGEYLEVMEEVDRGLLDGRPARAVMLPTASAEEGADRVQYWIDLGTEHFTRLGVEPVVLDVRTREDAERPDLAAQVAGAGLVYLSGGNPGYLADTLRDTAVWQAIVAAWHAGSAVAGCSAGACALTRIAQDIRRRDRSSEGGLGLIGGLAVIPHFDRIREWVPDIAELYLSNAPEGVTVVGVDEETALVGRSGDFVVAGQQAAWVLGAGSEPKRYEAGSVLAIG